MIYFCILSYNFDAISVAEWFILSGVLLLLWLQIFCALFAVHWRFPSFNPDIIICIHKTLISLWRQLERCSFAIELQRKWAIRHNVRSVAKTIRWLPFSFPQRKCEFSRYCIGRLDFKAVAFLYPIQVAIQINASSTIEHSRLWPLWPQTDHKLMHPQLLNALRCGPTLVTTINE